MSKKKNENKKEPGELSRREFLKGAGLVVGWLSYIKERIEYWKGQEKAKKIATVYKY